VFHRRPASEAGSEGKPLGRKVLGTIGTIVTPDTILAWASSKSENALAGYSSTIIDGRCEMGGLSSMSGHYVLKEPERNEPPGELQ
jgi:hypothetical protein